MKKLTLSLAIASLLPTMTQASDQLGSVTSGSAFNPQVSLILDGGFYHDNRKGAAGEVIEESAGILHGAHFHEHEHGMENGFNLGESELVLSATVDPYLEGKFTATFSGHGDVELEEAWLQTRALPAGLKVKAGKFLSEIGYQNSQHPHTWDFADQNLAYAGILGDHGLMDTGLQATWLTPAPFYLLVGAEALQGNDQERFGTLIEEDDIADAGYDAASLPEHIGGPRIGTVFAKMAPDLGDNHALQVGLAWAKARQYQQVVDEDASAVDDEMALDGSQTLGMMDIVYKYDGAGEHGAGDIKVVAEYLQLRKSMTVTSADLNAPLATDDAVKGRQAGYSLQATWGIAPRWQVGVRHDATGVSARLEEGSDAIDLQASRRNALAVTFYPSEFSRLRLQFAKADIADEEGEKTGVEQVMLGYTLSIGPHGAHKF